MCSFSSTQRASTVAVAIQGQLDRPLCCSTDTRATQPGDSIRKALQSLRVIRWAQHWDLPGEWCLTKAVSITPDFTPFGAESVDPSGLSTLYCDIRAARVVQTSRFAIFTGISPTSTPEDLDGPYPDGHLYIVYTWRRTRCPFQRGN